MRHFHALSLITSLSLLCVASPAFAQGEDDGEAIDQDSLWRTDTAHTLPARRVEIGLFSPTRYGLTDSVELQSNLLLDAALPNLGAQVSWTDLGKWTLGSRHTVRYMTRLFALVSAEGTGGFIPANVEPPQMIELDNVALFTRSVDSSNALTLELGVSVAPQLTDGVTPSGSLPVIDFPFLYQRTAAANGGATMRAGVAMAGALMKRLEYTMDFDVYYNPAIFLAPVLEQGTKIAWRASSRLSLEGGYRLTVAKYPYGTRLHALPTIDLRVGF